LVLEGIQITFDGTSKFTLNATMEDTVSGTIDIDVEWSSYAILEFYVFIDTKIGIIKEYYLNFKNDIIIGANTTINEITYGFKAESSSNTFTLEYSFLLPIFASVIIFLNLILIKKRKK